MFKHKEPPLKPRVWFCSQAGTVTLQPPPQDEQLLRAPEDANRFSWQQSFQSCFPTAPAATARAHTLPLPAPVADVCLLDFGYLGHPRNLGEVVEGARLGLGCAPFRNLGSTNKNKVLGFWQPPTTNKKTAKQKLRCQPGFHLTTPRNRLQPRFPFCSDINPSPKI